MITRPRVPAATLVRAGRAVPGNASPRFVLDAAQWRALAERLQDDPLPAAGLWCDGEQVHALFEEGPDSPLIASVAVEAKRFLALSPARPILSVPERIVRDLWGVEAMDALDLRPWLDHGAWTQTAPLSARPGPAAWPPEPPEFIWTDEDEWVGAMQLPIGPVQTVLDGPAQLRVTLVGERVSRVEPLLGFNHRGVAFRLRGSTPADAARLVERIDATACVAHQCAFADAVESATALVVDGGTRALRQAMVALERIALQLRRAAPSPLAGQLLDACSAGFGHRLMRGAIEPGGWARQPSATGLERVADALLAVERAHGRTDAPALRRDLVAARRGLAMPFAEDVSPLRAGSASGEGLGTAETVRGALRHWVRIENGLVTAWHAVDPAIRLLFELVRAAPGETLDGLLWACRAKQLPVAGADQ